MALSQQNVQVLSNYLSTKLNTEYNIQYGQEEHDLLRMILRELVQNNPNQGDSEQIYVQRINSMLIPRYQQTIEKYLQKQRPPQQEPQRPQQIQQPPQPEQKLEEQPEMKQDMVKYQLDNLNMLKTQLERSNSELKEENENLKHKIDTLNAKLAELGEKKEQRKQFVLNSQHSRGTDELFSFLQSHKNVYKIVLTSGIMFCYNDFNIFDGNNRFIVKEDNNTIIIDVESGLYNVKELTTAIKNKLNEESSEKYEVQFDDVLNRVYIKSDVEFGIEVTELSKMLGFCEARQDKKIYVSDQHPRVTKNNVCYMKLKANDNELNVVESNNEEYFAMLYDLNDRKKFTLLEPFEYVFDDVIKLNTIDIEMMSQFKHYTTKEVSFELKFDVYVIQE